MDKYSLGEKIKGIGNACCVCAQSFLSRTKKPLIALFQHLNFILSDKIKKIMLILNPAVKKAWEKIKRYISSIKTICITYYKSFYSFLIERNDKKSIISHHVHKYGEKLKKFAVIAWCILCEKTRKFFSCIVHGVEKNEKAASFIKKWSDEIKINYADLKKSIQENLIDLKNFLNRYEWYIQIIEASKPEDRKITLLTCFFSNLLALAFPLSLMQIYNRIIPNQSYDTLVILSIGVCVAILLEMVLRILRSYINLWADAKYEYTLSKKAFLNLIQMPLYLYEDTDIGTRIKQFAVLDQLRGFYNNQLMTAIFDIPFLCVFIIAMYYIADYLVLIPIFLGVMLVVMSFRHIDQSRDMLEKKLNLDAKENDFLVNVLGNIHTAKLLAIENLLIRRYERMQNTTIDVNYESTVHSGDMDSVKSIVSQMGTVVVGALGAIFVIHGELTVGSLIACVLLTGRFMMPLVRFVSALSRWKMINIIRHQLDVVLSADSEKQSTVSELEGEIELKNFSYLSTSNDNDHWVIKDVSVKIPPYSMVVVTSDSKRDGEQLLNLLSCITKQTAGEYLVDGKNLNQLNSYPIRNKIAYLSKSGVLFHGTIMDNISAFNPDLILEAERYAAILELNNVVLKLPLGYETPVGDKTVSALPGSVVNLIYVIRTLVSQPKIILFDPSDMDLDANVIAKLVAILKSLKRFSTVIVLSDDKATINLADVVFELKNGELKRVH